MPPGRPEGEEAISFLPATANVCSLSSEGSLVDIARGEIVEADLDRLITKRHDRRVADEGERPAEEMWRESERRYQQRRGTAEHPLLEAINRTRQAKAEADKP